MNVEQRRKIAEDGHVRSIYGGRFEPLSHMAMIFVPYIFLYANYGASSIGMHLLPLFVFLFLVSALSALSYFWVARVRELDGEVEITEIKGQIEASGFHIKSKGKYFIDGYKSEDGLFCQHTHILFFAFNKKTYASSWRYAGRGWHYVPFFTGTEQISRVLDLVGANKALNLTPKRGAD